MSLPVEILLWIAVVMVGGPIALITLAFVLGLLVAFIRGLARPLLRLSPRYREREKYRRAAKAMEGLAEAYHQRMSPTPIRRRGR